MSMVSHMKTTLNIDDTVMRRLKEEAARRKTTMSALVEAGLRLVLDGEQEPSRQRRELRPLPSWDGGEPRVDVADRAALSALLGDDEPPANSEA